MSECHIKGKKCTPFAWVKCPYAEYCASTYGVKEIEDKLDEILNDPDTTDAMKLYKVKNTCLVCAYTKLCELCGKEIPIEECNNNDGICNDCFEKYYG